MATLELHVLEKSPGPFSVFAWYKYSSASVSGIIFSSNVQCDPSKIKKKKVENLIKRIALNQSVLAVFYARLLRTALSKIQIQLNKPGFNG